MGHFSIFVQTLIFGLGKPEEWVKKYQIKFLEKVSLHLFLRKDADLGFSRIGSDEDRVRIGRYWLRWLGVL